MICDPLLAKHQICTISFNSQTSQSPFFHLTEHTSFKMQRAPTCRGLNKHARTSTQTYYIALRAISRQVRAGYGYTQPNFFSLSFHAPGLCAHNPHMHAWTNIAHRMCGWVGVCMCASVFVFMCESILRVCVALCVYITFLHTHTHTLFVWVCINLPSTHKICPECQEWGMEEWRDVFLLCGCKSSLSCMPCLSIYNKDVWELNFIQVDSLRLSEHLFSFCQDSVHLVIYPHCLP